MGPVAIFLCFLIVYNFPSTKSIESIIMRFDWFSKLFNITFYELYLATFYVEFYVNYLANTKIQFGGPQQSWFFNFHSHEDTQDRHMKFDVVFSEF